MFILNLESAASAARAEQKDITPVKAISSHKTGEVIQSEVKKDDENGTNADCKSSNAVVDKARRTRDRKIMKNMTEYMFDLFDANMMEEFHLISALEEEAIELFQRSDPEEFSFEMQALHDKFSALFESLIESFLNKENISIEEFYQIVHRTVETENPPSSGTKPKDKEIWELDSDDEDISDEMAYANAKEIVDVVYYYSDFHHWAGMIREQIKYRAHFQTFYQKIEQAVHNSHDNSTAPSSKK